MRNFGNRQSPRSLNFSSWQLPSWLPHAFTLLFLLTEMFHLNKILVRCACGMGFTAAWWCLCKSALKPIYLPRLCRTGFARLRVFT